MELEDSEDETQRVTNNIVQQKKDRIRILYTNADGVLNKREELAGMVEEHSPDVIALTEVKPKNFRFEIQENELALAGYDLFTNIKEKDTRGVAILVNQRLKASELKMSNHEGIKEVTGIQINSTSNTPLNILCFYRSPNSRDENTGNINRMIKSLKNEKASHQIVLGDFNYPGIAWPSQDLSGHTRAEADFIEATNEAFLQQMVSFPTRYRLNQEPHTLDLILTNEEQRIGNIKPLQPLGKSDHICITVDFNLDTSEQKQTRETFQYHKGNYDALSEELNIDWHKLLQGKPVAECWDIFKKKIQEAVRRNIPVSRSSGLRHKPTWMTREIRRKIRRKEKLWKRYLDTKQGQDYLLYAQTKNQLKRMGRKAKKNLEKQVAKQAKATPKGFWKYVNNKLNTR